MSIANLIENGETNVKKYVSGDFRDERLSLEFTIDGGTAENTWKNQSNVLQGDINYVPEVTSSSPNDITFRIKEQQGLYLATIIIINTGTLATADIFIMDLQDTSFPRINLSASIEIGSSNTGVGEARLCLSGIFQPTQPDADYKLILKRVNGGGGDDAFTGLCTITRMK